jgi:hypothetical protein
MENEGAEYWEKDSTTDIRVKPGSTYWDPTGRYLVLESGISRNSSGLVMYHLRGIRIPNEVEDIDLWIKATGKQMSSYPANDLMFGLDLRNTSE